MSEKKISKEECEELLLNWEIMNAALGEMTEPQLERLLDTELSGKRRASYIERIHSRLSKLRTKREREELTGGE